MVLEILLKFDPKQLTALTEILRLGSFEAAADALGVTQSAISQRLKALEDNFGSILVQRSTPCRGTAAGLRLAAHANSVTLMEAELSRELRQGAHASQALKPVVIAVNADSLATWVPTALDSSGAFRYEVLVDDESISAEWLRRREVMAAVTTQDSPLRGCNAYPLGCMRYISTASPAFIRQWMPEGPTPATLCKAPMLRFSANDNLQTNWLRQHFGAGLNPPVHFIPSTTVFVEATSTGLGWALNPASLVEPHLANGTLVEILPASHHNNPLYWQISRILAPALSSLTDKLRQNAKKGARASLAQAPLQ
ncbi:MAG: LysR family transcriptional regulator ArgP [Lentibacter sp.]|uniref:LysR family transcriptional regulator ArgP n=1 Tax=Lentibacter sp. TaxID=2024994 RepID=UPI00262D76D6|nr:LysR family transcriptional regulator ArgP [Lentibacter sp.]MDG1288355.1 LysR family transcriptional regulator ArgP [Lentibacter sp.]